MTTILKKTLEELHELPEDQQATLITQFEDMIARAKIDAKLAASEVRGGETRTDIFFEQIRAQIGGGHLLGCSSQRRHTRSD